MEGKRIPLLKESCMKSHLQFATSKGTQLTHGERCFGEITSKLNCWPTFKMLFAAKSSAHHHEHTITNAKHGGGRIMLWELLFSKHLPQGLGVHSYLDEKTRIASSALIHPKGV
ncbi:hypothetical protein XENORESO_011913 [Xenotaenia resolanae]|uniref:Uncharacterized protein n=1 Tax=Xenotaenia resolanae TaxID=208358 RepID=A0ABV0WM96_9TELE